MRPGPPNGAFGIASSLPGVSVFAFGAGRASARSGIAPALLLDVQTPSGDTYYWSDRPLRNIVPVIPPAVGGLLTVFSLSGPVVNYVPWLMGSGTLNYNRSTVADTGTLSIQNVSGNVLQRDFERIARRSTLEGSLFVFRYYQVDLAWAWIEQHGTLSCGDAGTTVPLNLSQLFAGSDDTPVQQVAETCQLNWAAGRCPSTQPTECLYTYQSCQVPERFVGIQTAFEVNNPAAAANLPTQTINRTRAW
jgi:hypothetical protein